MGFLGMTTNCFSVFLALSLLLVLGCAPAQPVSVPVELEQYVSEGPGAPFVMNPTPGTFFANVARDRSLSPEKQKELLERIVNFGHVSQLVVRNTGESIEGLKKLSNLEAIHLSFGAEASGRSVDLQSLKEMPKLKEISVGYEAGVQLSDATIAVPAGLINLSLFQLPVTSIEGLENCKSLQILDVSFNPKLEKVDGFRNLGPLKKLKISEGTLTRISAANILLSTEQLELTEASSFAKSKIRAVDVSVFGKDSLVNLDGLENWEGVKSVTLNYLQRLKDISALGRMAEVQEIVLVQCMLQGKAITQSDIESLVQKLPNCRILIQ